MTSHPSPFYRQRQSNKTLDPTGQTAKFLYTILKQLDLKNIDWNEVAHNLDITNGHAARMRWSRFRAQIEGLDNSYSRKGGRKKDIEKKRKRDNRNAADEKTNIHKHEDTGSKRVKAEPMSGAKAENYKDFGVDTNYHAVNIVKNEPSERKSTINGVPVHHPTMTTIHVPHSRELPNNHRQPDTAQHPFPYDNSSRSMLSSHGLPSGSYFNKVANHSGTQWPQQRIGPGHDHFTHQNTHSFSPFYSGPAVYMNQHAYPNAYMNQLQHRLQYDQQPAQTHFQRPPNRPSIKYSQTQVNSRLASPSTAANLPERPQPLSQSAYLNVTPADASKSMQPPSNDSDLVQSITATTSHPQNYVYELASEASYPWPYSEASLSQFIQQPQHSPQPEGDGSSKHVNDNESRNQSSELSMVNRETAVLSQAKVGTKDENTNGHIASTAEAATDGTDLSSHQDTLPSMVGGQINTETESTMVVRQDTDTGQGVYIKSESDPIEL